MSWQALLLRLQTRVLIRRRLRRTHDLDGLRRLFEDSARRLPTRTSGARYREVDEAGVRGAWVEAEGTRRRRTLYYLHGGAYLWGGPRPYADLAWRLSQAVDGRVFVLDYRLAPEHSCPAALDDAVAGYRWLLQQDIAPERLCMAGDSAGGGLAVAALCALRDAGTPLPAAAALISPWTDLSGSGDSMRRNDGADPMFTAQAVRDAAHYYAGKLPLADPRVSPLFAPLHDLPPLLVQAGASEVLLDDSRRFVERLRDAGGKAELQVWSGVPHVWHLAAFFVPEARRAILGLGAFLQEHSGG